MTKSNIRTKGLGLFNENTEHVSTNTYVEAADTIQYPYQVETDTFYYVLHNFVASFIAPPPADVQCALQ